MLFVRKQNRYTFRSLGTNLRGHPKFQQLNFLHKVVREKKVSRQTCWIDDNLSRGRLLLFSSLVGHLSPDKSKYRRTRGAVGHSH